MHLDPETCERARLSRDPRFDGRFFVGVRTTGIYCRPVCPARSPARRNVLYFPSAAAAAAEGFRPCLRCRPESAPGSPAWNGVTTTVARALRLMSESNGSAVRVRDLSDALGVTPRHLRRLFARHLGAPPRAIVQTSRLHFAKTLLDETSARIADVALASGFGSVRRFNDAFRRAYDRTPGEIRRAAARAPGSGWRLRLGYRAPLDWQAMIAFLAARAVPGVEQVDGDIYRRSFRLDGRPGWLEVRPDPRGAALRLHVHHPDPRSLYAVVARVRRMFDLDADPEEIRERLGRDPMLASSVRRAPGIRVPGTWDGFELAVRAVLGQHVSVRAATTFAGRLVRRHGAHAGTPASGAVARLFPEPWALCRVDRSVGLTRARAHSVERLARAAVSGTIAFDGSMSPEEVRARLLEIPGIGTWTVETIAMRALGDPDAFPASDLGIRVALATSGRRASAAEARRHATRWRPWRAYAAMHLWRMS